MLKNNKRYEMKKMFIIGMLLLPSLVFADEKFEYELKVLGSEYGTASLYFDGNKGYGQIKANQKWASVWNVDNRIASQVDETGYPIKTQFTYNFDKYKGAYDIDHGKSRVRVLKERNGVKKRKSFVIKQRMHDMISWLAEVRTAVIENPDKPLSFKVFSGAKVYDVHCQPQPKELLHTPIGAKTAKPYLITVTRPSIYKREMRVWFNTTKNFEPLKLVGKFKVGHGEANIVSLKSNEKGEQQ